MTDRIFKSLDLAISAAAAFDVFVNRMSSWWPLGSHAVSASEGKAAQAVTVEPRVGGAVFEIMHDGRRSDWGEVLEFEAGRRFVMSWHPGSGKDMSTRVQVVFEDLPGDGVRITLTHAGWEVWGDAAGEKRANYDAGWDVVLGVCFVKACLPG